MTGYTKQINTREIALVGLLSSVCVVSRLTLQFIPNIKPVTAIIIIISAKLGCRLGVKLSIISTVISNMLLGMGPWTFFQILAWTVIAFISGLIRKTSLSRSVLFMSCFAFFCGYIFGLVVSFERFLYGGFEVYLTYYLAGLYFDTLHAIGNFIFMLLIFNPLNNILSKNFKI